ncbi:MAG: hypothetical protein KDC76_02855 [Bacteroidetes bacterium]|nr:hypothetical protein [Bacteroidota bacterium]
MKVMHKFRISFILLLLSPLVSKGQHRDSVYLDSIRNIEYQLEGLTFNIINGVDENERVTSCYYFIQTLKKALQVPNSFEYSFPLLNKVRTVSILKPSDDKFRLFTWNLLLDSGRYMYFGALQMNRSDSLILYGLYDSSDYLKDVEYETFDNRHWVGALYYQIHPYKYKRKSYYMLFGWDGEDEFINKKVIDVLWFDEDDKPQFGAPVFAVDDEIQSRMIFKFAEQAVLLCRYDKQEKLVVYANTVPVNPMQKGMYEYYLPDGSYSYLKFSKGFWVLFDDLFYDRRKNAHELRNRVIVPSEER